MQQGGYNITPSPGEPLLTNVVQEHNSYFVQNPDILSNTLHAGKSLTTLSPDITYRTESVAASRVAGGSSPAVTGGRARRMTPANDSHLREEVEELRRVVETLKVTSSRDREISPADDNDLREEVEQLRRVVETLSTQQVQQQPQVVYQRDGLPDEPPPVYDDCHVTRGFLITES